MKRELFGWELRKLGSFPALWGFLVFCVLLNAVMSDPERADWSETSCMWYAHQAVRLLHEKREDLRTPEEAVRFAAETLPEGEWRETVLGELSELARGMGHAEKNVTVSEFLHSFALGSAGVAVQKALFRVLCRYLLLEGMLLSALMALYLYGLEYAQNTAATVYASAMGRRVEMVKLMAGTVFAILTYVVLAVVSLCIFYNRWDVPLYFKADMASPFHGFAGFGEGEALKRLYGQFTVEGYLLAVLALGAFFVILFQFLGAMAGFLTGNTYMGFLLLAVLMLADSSLPQIAAQQGRLASELALWTPMGLWSMMGQWFTDLNGLGSVPWQECFGLLACFAVTLPWFAVLYQRYDMQDL